MENSLVLAIDNSIDLLTLALASGERFIEERNIKESRAPSQILPEHVASILGDNGCSVGDVTDIVVTLGPGSFTGIRVALSFCKGLSAATGVRVRGIPTLDALAFPLSDREGSLLCPLIDAKKGEVFYCLFRASQGKLSRLTGYGAVRPEGLPGIVRGPAVFFGTGTKVCAKKLEDIEDAVVLNGTYDSVSGRMLTEERWAGHGIFFHDALKPVYGRRSEAEIKFNINID